MEVREGDVKDACRETKIQREGGRGDNTRLDRVHCECCAANPQKGYGCCGSTAIPSEGIVVNDTSGRTLPLSAEASRLLSPEGGAGGSARNATAGAADYKHPGQRTPA